MPCISIFLKVATVSLLWYKRYGLLHGCSPPKPFSAFSLAEIAAKKKPPKRNGEEERPWGLCAPTPCTAFCKRWTKILLKKVDKTFMQGLLAPYKIH